MVILENLEWNEGVELLLGLIQFLQIPDQSIPSFATMIHKAGGDNPEEAESSSSSSSMGGIEEEKEGNPSEFSPIESELN